MSAPGGQVLSNARLTAALAASRLASLLARKLSLGGGTVLPGHVATWVYPAALELLAARLRHGSILISGTNGKTTTARMLASIARAAGLTPVHNRAGANLPAGLVSALTASTALSGHPDGDLGIFEVDEAHLAAVTASVHPRIIVLTNLFRDQLDRYGEIDFVARSWSAAIADPAADALQLVLNVDDPVLGRLAEARGGASVAFGLQDRSCGSAALAHEADRRLCPVCSGRLQYDWSFYGHLGSYRCEACGWTRPEPQLGIVGVGPLTASGTRVTLSEAKQSVDVEVPLSGLHNVYNATAAAGAARAIGLDWSAIVAGLAAAETVFGRQERIPVGTGGVTLTLVKNPVGFNQALRTVTGASPILIAINDRFADGTDISWLWDVDFELLASYQPPVLCSGLRAHDMALRLKYAGIEHVSIEPQLARAVDWALGTAENGTMIVAFCTYTATLEARQILQRKHLVAPFWED